MQLYLPVTSPPPSVTSSSRSRSTPASNNPLGEAFAGPEMWGRLTADPTTRAYLQQPDFVKMMQDIQKNPNNLNLHLKDQRIMQALGVLLNLKIHNPMDDADMPEASPPSPPQERKREAEPSKAEKQPEPEPEPMEVTEEEKESKERKALAQKEKEAGNAAYKKKDFETAIQHYSKALELDDEDISFLTNRANELVLYLFAGVD